MMLLAASGDGALATVSAPSVPGARSRSCGARLAWRTRTGRPSLASSFVSTGGSCAPELSGWAGSSSPKDENALLVAAGAWRERRGVNRLSSSAAGAAGEAGGAGGARGGGGAAPNGGAGTADPRPSPSSGMLTLGKLGTANGLVSGPPSASACGSSAEGQSAAGLAAAGISAIGRPDAGAPAAGRSAGGRSAGGRSAGGRPAGGRPAGGRSAPVPGTSS